MMLTLSNIASRIDALESVEYSGNSERHATWQLMIAHKFGQSVRMSPWWVHSFTGVIGCDSDGWTQERVSISFSHWVTEAIEAGFSQSELSGIEAMYSAIRWVSDALNDDWEWFYDAKRKEAEAHEKRLLYRRLCHEATLTPDGAEWLQANDSDFLEHEAMKAQVDIDTLISQRLAKITKPLQDDPARLAYIEARIQAITTPQPEPTASPIVGPVKVRFNGPMPDGSFSIATVDGIKPVFKDTAYFVNEEVWQNLVNTPYPAGWWVRA